MDDFTPCSIVLRSVRYVNERNLEGIASLILEDVKFTDIRGRVYREKEFMAEYSSEVSNYEIHVHHALQRGDGVAIIGKTTRSHVSPEIEEKEILVWTAGVRDGLISEWRIYSNDERATRS